MECTVSVCCLTYNHGDFIEDCLNGILNQSLDFGMELLIHDDASTDGTADIIREYEKKYPDVIKPIYETENQWKKGRRGSVVFNFPRAKGEYIALCEGDDYWIDPYKLKKQLEAMKRNEKQSLCFHPAEEAYADHSLKNRVICKHADEACVWGLNEIILGGGGFMPTASILFKREMIEQYPMWIAEVPVADTFLQVYSARNGGALYIPDVMSVYRRFVPGSWTEKNNLGRRVTYDLYREYIKFYKLMKDDFKDNRPMIDYCIAFLSKLLALNEKECCEEFAPSEKPPMNDDPECQ